MQPVYDGLVKDSEAPYRLLPCVPPFPTSHVVDFPHPRPALGRVGSSAGSESQSTSPPAEVRAETTHGRQDPDPPHLPLSRLRPGGHTLTDPFSLGPTSVTSDPSRP